MMLLVWSLNSGFMSRKGIILFCTIVLCLVEYLNWAVTKYWQQKTRSQFTTSTSEWEWTWMVKSVEADTKELSHVWLCHPLRISFKLWLCTFRLLRLMRLVSQCQSCCIKYGNRGCPVITDHFKLEKHVQKVLGKMMILHLLDASDPGFDFGDMYGIPLVFQVFKTNHNHNKQRRALLIYLIEWLILRLWYLFLLQWKISLFPLVVSPIK